MKNFLRMALVPLLLYSSASLATSDSISYVDLSASVSRHCSMALTGGSQPGESSVAPSTGTTDNRISLSFGDLYEQDGQAPHAKVEVSAQAHIECNGDFELKATSAQGGLKYSRSRKLGLLPYSIKSVKINSAELLPNPLEVTPALKSAGADITQENFYKITGAASDSVNQVIDHGAELVLSAPKGQYPASNEYLDTVELELSTIPAL